MLLDIISALQCLVLYKRSVLNESGHVFEFFNGGYRAIHLKQLQVSVILALFHLIIFLLPSSPNREAHQRPFTPMKHCK